MNSRKKNSKTDRQADRQTIHAASIKKMSQTLFTMLKQSENQTVI